MSQKTSDRQEKMMQKMFRGKGIWKQLNTGFIDEHVRVVREYIANLFFYTKNGKIIMIDADYNYPRLPDPQAPYDGYDESDDTKENTEKKIPLEKKIMQLSDENKELPCK